MSGKSPYGMPDPTSTATASTIIEMCTAVCRLISAPRAILGAEHHLGTYQRSIFATERELSITWELINGLYLLQRGRRASPGNLSTVYICYREGAEHHLGTYLRSIFATERAPSITWELINERELSITWELINGLYLLQRGRRASPGNLSTVYICYREGAEHHLGTHQRSIFATERELSITWELIYGLYLLQRGRRASPGNSSTVYICYREGAEHHLGTYQREGAEHHLGTYLRSIFATERALSITWELINGLYLLQRGRRASPGNSSTVYICYREGAEHHLGTHQRSIFATERAPSITWELIYGLYLLQRGSSFGSALSSRGLSCTLKPERKM
ncbi:hypothetical protein RRG08_031315 [Elysia crispata]|uniref:Uncharacterized protein n=1 Tax=Elysia crispata TaxID=231223 RepID=A0AAE0YJZ7_9GAST|nr:hypothetical protein RRG08_031315 [Elysia crispata]